ncbi:MAG: 6-phosphofructokinase [Pseudobdellovibrionaceae bacterium]
MRIGIMTGGGDAPGLNGIIESVSKTLLQHGASVLGIEDGFDGFVHGRTRVLTQKDVEGCHQLAGTVLGTSNKFGLKGHEQDFVKKYKEYGLDGLIIAGGDGTFANLKDLHHEVNILGVPKTIDNDLSGTDITFGYDTACSVVARSIDALRSTAEAHRRIIFVETMGRTAGWIALGGGLASYADAILLPEVPFEIDKLIAHLKQQSKIKRGLVIAVAEGAKPIGEEATVAFRVEGSPQAERYGGIAQKLCKIVEKEMDMEARQVVLGHLQRAEHPTTTDRFLTLAMGVQVATEALQKRWKQAVVYRDGKVMMAPLEDLMGPPRLVEKNHRWLKLTEALGIFVGDL